jgi:hypothetical protein
MKSYVEPRAWTDSLAKRPKLRKTKHNIWYNECNEFVLGRIGNDSFEKLSKYKLYLVGV